MIKFISFQTKANHQAQFKSELLKLVFEYIFKVISFATYLYLQESVVGRVKVFCQIISVDVLLRNVSGLKI